MGLTAGLSPRLRAALSEIAALSNRAMGVIAHSKAASDLITELVKTGHVEVLGWTARLDDPACRRVVRVTDLGREALTV